MQKLLIATKNKGKLQEFSDFLSDLPIRLVSLTDVGISDDVEEDGKTYEENSQKKALFYAKKSGLPAIADDGGIEIAALNGAPGVRSRRWIGYEASDEELTAHMKKVAVELPESNRDAKFVTVVSFALPDGTAWSAKGEVAGIIAKKPLTKLLRGYPYRSFFYLPDIQKYYHEESLTKEEMKRFNHRLKAVRQLRQIILENI
ncbi:MAG: non-canonical purine NTP pyrophosphatase [Candidatus Levybacteria bacterium]|nr:non-canonical purine NTP pyrophosphatase [Candidatus Levybacteria bacterium]